MAPNHNFVTLKRENKRVFHLDIYDSQFLLMLPKHQSKSSYQKEIEKLARFKSM
jgi:hypothetical protein